MQSYSLPRRGAFRRVLASAFAAGAVALGACGGEQGSPQGPQLPGNPTDVPALKRASFIVDVDTRNGRMKVTPPELTGTNPSIAALGGRAAGGSQSYSLLTRDAINLQATNFFSSPVGAIQPNKIRVSFDLAVENKLSTVRLITPTFPQAPAGQSGLLLFPFSATAVTTSGGTSVTDDNVVVITLPSGGVVTPSVDWNGGASLDKPAFPFPPGPGGNPFSFFNDKSCSAVPDPQAASDCFRYETYGVLQPAVVSGARRVGFDIDATVGQFRVFVLAAADLEAATVQTGTVTGTITGDDGRGPLANVEVTIQGRPPVLTNASGVFTDAAVPAPSNRSITVNPATLPAFCQPPQATGTLTPANGQIVAVTASGTATQNYTVDCAPPPPVTGQLTVNITRTGPGTQSLATAVLRINPTPADAGADVTITNLTPLSFVRTVNRGTGANAGEGVVTLENLPALCTNPGPAAYSGLGGTGGPGSDQTVGITLFCDVPAPRYVFRSQWGAISGGQVDLTLSFDPTGFNDPLINGAGADGFAGYGAVTTLTGSAASRLTAVTGVAAAPFASPTINATLPVVASLANTTGGDIFALANVAVLRFTVGAGAAGTVTTSTSGIEISTSTGDTFGLVFSGAGQNIDVIEGTLNIP